MVKDNQSEGYHHHVKYNNGESLVTVDEDLIRILRR